MGIGQSKISFFHCRGPVCGPQFTDSRIRIFRRSTSLFELHRYFLRNSPVNFRPGAAPVFLLRLLTPHMVQLGHSCVVLIDPPAVRLIRDRSLESGPSTRLYSTKARVKRASVLTYTCKTVNRDDQQLSNRASL